MSRLTLGGQLTLKAAHDFEDELTALLTIASRIEVDFNDLESISGAGLQSLLRAQRTLDKKGGSMELKGLQGQVYRSFEELGFLELFDIRKTPEKG